MTKIKLINSNALFHELETERLILKNISKDDRDFIFHQFSNKDVTEYLLDAEPFTSIKEADDIIDFYITPEPRAQHRWILILKENHNKIGTCGFHYWNKENGSVEVGYDLQKIYWNKGIMTEALQAIIQFAKEELHVKYIDAHIYPENIRSVSLALKLGFMKSLDTVTYTFRDREYLHNIYRLNCQGNNIFITKSGE